MPEGPSTKSDFAASIARVLELSDEDFASLEEGLRTIAPKPQPQQEVSIIEKLGLPLQRADIAAAITAGSDFYTSGFSTDEVEGKSKTLLKHLGLLENGRLTKPEHAQGRIERIINAFSAAARTLDIRQALYSHEREYRTSETSIDLSPVISMTDGKEEMHSLVVKCNLKIEYFQNNRSRSIHFGLDMADIEDLIFALEDAKSKMTQSGDLISKPGIRIIKSIDDV